MRDNMDLKKALEASTCRSEELLKLHASISLEFEGVRREMNLYRDEVRQLCVWLGLYNTEGKNIVEVPSAEGDPSHNEEVFSTIITTSPILLALRRSLLKDFSDRSVHTSSKQLQEIGNSVAQLKNEISHFATVEKVKSVVNELHSREENNPSGSVDKRLKAIESNYVKREEFTNSMKTKVDNLVLPAKADNAVVSDIDRRINEKLADMEERLLLYEMERKDFRTILKNLVNSNGVGGVGEVNSASPAPPRSVNNRPEGQDSAALQLTPRDPRDDAQGSSHSKQVYKVVGTSRGTFATTSTVSPEEKKVTKHSKKASSPSPKEEVVGKEAVGLTANQAAYAVFVTNENKEKIESLPPLNYEKMKK
ncbi:hypothetical protein AGDE_11639 [Angomonas deanei]|uniref:Uncharacterized protein n=1 Tax=Angomonas deanei TaxID=59799 RepID=A0A7G2CNM3_9TRYP|nr:hypothetical protein AGDE_11639 [Angomonas deanei]CAD2221380.1 hypothetical protein, conserved [Angomonas deanei]|eukprot:EPY25904.1 hypothetical protein AGDE_11639 [Angomonas deanei]